MWTKDYISRDPGPSLESMHSPFVCGREQEVSSPQSSLTEFFCSAALGSVMIAMNSHSVLWFLTQAGCYVCVTELENEGEVKVHHGLAISGDNVEKFDCRLRLNFSNSENDKRTEIQWSGRRKRSAVVRLLWRRWWFRHIHWRRLRLWWRRLEVIYHP